MDMRPYQTELPSNAGTMAKSNEQHINFMSIIPEIPASQDSHSKDSTVEDAEPTFRFERGRLEQLHIEAVPNAENDEVCIEHIKEDIIKQGQSAHAEWERLSTRLWVLGMVMVALGGAEIMGALTALLALLALQTPVDQVMIWVGTMVLLCMGHLYMAVRAHQVARSTSVPALQDFLCCSLLFLSLFTIAFLLILVCVAYLCTECGRRLRADQKSNLQLLRGMLLASTGLKLGLQCLCLYHCVVLKGRLTFIQSLPLPESALPSAA